MDLRKLVGAAAALTMAAVIGLGCGGGDGPLTVEELEDQIFSRSCAFSTCHRGASPAGGMGLETPVYDSIVLVESSQVPGRMRVVPFDPEASYLFEKISSDTPADGDRMPPTAPLSEERIEQIRAWIEAGAEP